MREDYLVADELARALREHLTEKRKIKLIDNPKKEFPKKEFLNKIINYNLLNNDYIKINKEYLEIPIKDELAEGLNEEVHQYIIPNRPPLSSSLNQESERLRFMQDSSQTLGINSSEYLRCSEDVILESIKRDVRSIAYAYTTNDDIKQQAILEAKRQGYVFHADTPIFMLQNPELIKLSAKLNINSINFVPGKFWTNELAAFVYQIALKSNYILSQYSPSFFKNNIEIIKQSLKLDPKSSVYVAWSQLTPDIISEIENYIVSNELTFIINNKIPVNFRRNADICIKSIENDPNYESLAYIDWDYIALHNPDGMRKIIDILVKKKYVLNSHSPDFLRNTTTICLNSVKIDINSANYFSDDLDYWLKEDLELFPVENKEDEELKNRIIEIRHYLIKNGYYSLEQFRKFTSSLLKDEVILDYYLEQMGVSKEKSNATYYERIKSFIKSCLCTPLKVSSTRKVFQMIAQKKWEQYRKENEDYYTNIFNRICDSLEKNDNFITALNELRFLIKVDDVLDERKYALFNAFIEYHHIYHNSKAENKTELLQEKRDGISKYAALFISKSKEDFISEELNELDKLYKQFFVIKIDNPIVKKKVVEVKQRDMLKKLFASKDVKLLEQLQTIKNKYMAYNYSASINKASISNLLDLFITKSINENVPNIDEFLSSSKPLRFDEYEVYEKVSKLINRLNSHNISFDGPEVNNYRDLIFFDGKNYAYKGNEFSDNELYQIKGYKDLKYVYGKIKGEIIQIAKGIDSFDHLSKEDIDLVIEDCTFTDEYYEFDFQCFTNFYVKVFDLFVQCFENEKSLILDDNIFRLVLNFGVNTGLIQFVLTTGLGLARDKNNSHFSEIEKYIKDKEVADILANIPNLMSLITVEEFNMDNLGKLLDYKEMLKYANLEQIALLGKEVIKKIYSNNGFTSTTQKERINVACDLLISMINRHESTVPLIKGSYDNYMYSMYDSTDEELLTAGLDTNACFRCCGNDNDFLHYCALDKNGFVIKITDCEGNFIGRASGFRNGNGVYINQLRTIYDKKTSAYDSEKSSIIKAFEQACSDIVDASQKNQDEINKIDFVVVTKSYLLSDLLSNVDNDTTRKIGSHPMDTESDDWKCFVTTTKNLRESKERNYFYNDYSGYPIICIKSAIGDLTPEKIKKGDVPALYHRTRKQVSIRNTNENLENYVNKIRALFSHQTDKDFTYLKIPQGLQIAYGDNWYIVLDKNQIIDSCYLPSDNLAKIEFETFMDQLLLRNANLTEHEQEAIPQK